jgi:hypothetical protein
MKILTKIPKVVSRNYATEQFQSGLYPLPISVTKEIENKLLPGSTTVLFSGGHRLEFDATYIEPKMFAHANVKWQPRTLFVDPANSKLLFYSIQKLSPANLLILNTSVCIQYQTWEKISTDIDIYKKYASQVIASLPIERFDFNRLKYSAQDIAELLQGTLVDNTVVICR